MWSPQAVVTLMDRVPGDMGGGILRVALAPDVAAEVMRLERAETDAEVREFLVPLPLLKDAYVTLVK